MLKVELTSDSKVTRAGTKYNTMTDTVSVTVNAALPPFCEENPRAWFRLVDARFVVTKTTDDVEKTSRVLEALPSHVFKRIASWLVTQPEELVYKDLKDELLSHFMPSQHTRMKQVLEMVTNPSDRPSERWRTMDELQYNRDGTKVDVMWELWLLSLHPQVRTQIQQSTEPRSIIIRRADSLQKQLIDEDAQKPIMAAQPKQGKQRDRNYTPKDDKIVDGYCWFHRTFRNRARQCLQGCKKYDPSKNANNGGQQ